MSDQKDAEKKELDNERSQLLNQYEEWVELPMLILGLAWLILLVIDLLGQLNAFFSFWINAIWIIFILDFAIRFTLVPQKIDYLRQNWLTAISLAVPALRVFRVARAIRVLRLARTARGLNLVRVIGSLNRGMRALGRSFGRRGFGYVLALTVIVTLVGAAGMYAFEGGEAVEGGLHTYGEALWWTSMVMTTLGTQYSPFTLEGRILAFLLSLYAFAIFGYITATLASFFIGQEAESEEGDLPSVGEIRRLQAEIEALRLEIHALNNGVEPSLGQGKSSESPSH